MEMTVIVIILFKITNTHCNKLQKVKLLYVIISMINRGHYSAKIGCLDHTGERLSNIY